VSLIISGEKFKRRMCLIRSFFSRPMPTSHLHSNSMKQPSIYVFFFLNSKRPSFV
jgi:hypothetical protein